jgi:hypothetical protein
LHPISAQGGNGALETAAVLVNTLIPALKARGASKVSLTQPDIDAIFTRTQETRFQRAVDAVNQGRHTTSASIKETFFSKFFVDYFFPYFGQSLIFSLIVKNTMRGPCIADLPIPERHAKAIERHNNLDNQRFRKSWITWSILSSAAGILFVIIYSNLGLTRHQTNSITY